MTNEMTNEIYLREAYLQASMSRDSSNQNGAVLASDDYFSLSSNNDFPEGVEFTEERANNRPEKYRYFEHAERNVIYKAARSAVGTQDTVLYCPWVACCDCARGIIQAGIKEVVAHKQRMEMTPERWIPSIQEALSMLGEAGVAVNYYDGPIAYAKSVIVNGKIWNPADKPLDAGVGNWYTELGEIR